MKEQKKWIQIRKDLYHQVERQVQHLLGQDTPELMRYRKQYDREFVGNWSVSTKEDLIDKVGEASIVLMGDFHALHQSQKAHIRVLRQISNLREVVLAVEFFDSKHQKHIDDYVDDKISEKNFLSKIDWEKKWGFPWEHYKPIIIWAKQNGVRIVGINRAYKTRSFGTLKSRDEFAAQKIAQCHRRSPNALIFVIYGDLHLAARHIPYSLVERLGKSINSKTVRIFQNSEKIYFELLQKKIESDVDVVQISKNAFCLMSVPPWVKWQNYLLYLERTYDSGLLDFSSDADDDDDECESGVIDYTDYISRYVLLMADELGVKIDISSLSVYTVNDPYFWDQVREKFSVKQIKWIDSMISAEMSFYLPEIGVAYLARGTVNHAASVAIQYIYYKLCKQGRFLFDMPNDFLAAVWIEGISYFGSKMINPKRKTDTLVDLKNHLQNKSVKVVEKDAMKIAISQRMIELMHLSGVARSRSLVEPKKKWSYYVAARILGGMLGERIFAGYSNKTISSKKVLELMKKEVNCVDFKQDYYSLIKLAEATPVPFRSKKEKL